MRRRSVLRVLALSVAGLAGCAGGGDERDPPPTRPPTATRSPTPTPTPEPTIPTPTPSPFVDGLRTDITAVTVGQGESGRLVVTVPVENTADLTLDADLLVTVQGTESYTARQRISVSAGATRTETVVFEVDWNTASGDGQPQVREILLLTPGATLDG